MDVVLRDGVCTNNMQMGVSRRPTIETVLLLRWFTRGADTPADQGEEAPFFPDLKPQHEHWTEGSNYLLSFPPEEVPWQYQSMP